MDQDVYDEPLLPVPEKTHTGARAPLPDHDYWDTITDEQYAQQWRA